MKDSKSNNKIYVAHSSFSSKSFNAFEDGGNSDSRCNKTINASNNRYFSDNKSCDVSASSESSYNSAYSVQRHNRNFRPNHYKPHFKNHRHRRNGQTKKPFHKNSDPNRMNCSDDGSSSSNSINSNGKKSYRHRKNRNGMNKNYNRCNYENNNGPSNNRNKTNISNNDDSSIVTTAATATTVSRSRSPNYSPTYGMWNDQYNGGGGRLYNDNFHRNKSAQQQHRRPYRNNKNPNHHHHQQQQQQRHNQKRRHINWKYDRNVSSIALKSYLKECGWSLPGTDDENSNFIGFKNGPSNSAQNTGLTVQSKSNENENGCEMKRKHSLALLERILYQWTHSVEENRKKKGMPTDNSDAVAPSDLEVTASLKEQKSQECDRSNVTLITFGSFRLGAYKEDADVDLLALCPSACSRNDFFTTLVRVMEDEPSICDIHPISSAFTPVLKFTINSIHFDMLFGRICDESNFEKILSYRRKVPSPQFKSNSDNDIDKAVVDDKDGKYAKSNVHGDHHNKYESLYDFPIDDSFLIGMDDGEVRSANGVRVTQYILDCVPDRDRFRLVLSAVKEWAIVHGIYSNVLGFLGGINLAIMTAYVCQRNPHQQPTLLLKTFFHTFATWNWPRPVILNEQQQSATEYSSEVTNTGGMRPWDPKTNKGDARHVMPIITPVFPRMNSAYNVGLSQQRRIQEELVYAAYCTRNEFCWKSLYSPSNFFDRHANFLQITISGKSSEFTQWSRLCESRLRLLICSLDSPSMSVWPFAKLLKRERLPDYENTKEAYNQQLHREALFFVGLRFATNIDSIDLNHQASEFLINHINSWEGRKPGMDFKLQHVLRQDLPHDLIGKHLNNGRHLNGPDISLEEKGVKSKNHASTDILTGTSVPRRDIESSSFQPAFTTERYQLQKVSNAYFEGVPPSPRINCEEKEETQDDSARSKANQEQLFNFLTGKTEDLPLCVGSNDECTHSSEEASSTRSPVQKRARNRERSGTEDSFLLSD